MLLTYNFLALGNSSCFDCQVLPIESNQVSPSVFRMVPVVYTNGYPVTICNQGFNDQDAAAVCRSIGQSIGLQFSGKCTHFLSFLFLKLLNATLRYRPGGRAMSGVFNSSVGVLTVQDVNCTGSELGLL